MIAIVAEQGGCGFSQPPGAPRTTTRLSRIVVNANIAFDPSVDGFSPTVNCVPVALDDIVDYLIAVELKVWLDRCCVGFHVVVIALHISQMSAMRRMSEQIATTFGINRSSILDQDLLGVEDSPGVTPPPAKNFPVCAHRKP